MNLKAWLVCKNMSIKQLSKLVNISYSALCYKIEDVDKFTVGEFKRIAEATEMPVDVKNLILNFF